MRKESIEGKRIAIYGGTSKIAQKTALQALHEGAEVRAFVRNPAKAEDLARAGVEIVVGDITNRKDVMMAVENQGIDVTINFTANFDQSANPDRSREVNVDGEAFVLNATEQYYIPRHIFISTIGVQMEGENAYKNTKLEAEKLVRESNVPEWMILRYANVLGTQDPNDLWNNPFITKQFLGKNVGISKIPTRPRASFSYLGIDTASDATLAAMTAEPNQTITILDGFTTVQGYLAAMAKINQIDFMLAIPGSIMHPALVAFNRAARVVGKDFPLTPGTSRMITHPPELEFQTMTSLGVEPNSFDEVVSRIK
jgi:nucleoside-diphosphate-sugar epimerase